MTQKSSSNDKEYWKVIQKHHPNYVDEIPLNIGDIVIVTARFDDGWAFGTNTTTQCDGSFPLNCLTGLDGPDMSENEKGKTQLSRASSLVNVLKKEHK